MTIEPCLNSKDLPEAIMFYTQVLDFELVVAPDPDPEQFGSRYAALSREGSIVHLSSHARENVVFGVEIYIRVSNVDEVCASYIKNGIELSVPDGGNSPVNQTWGMREIGFRDPDGNKITVGQLIE